MVRASVRLATVADLDLLVRHRRSMFESIGTFSNRDLDAADTAYRRWARTRLRSEQLAGFIVERAGLPVASGCAWIMDVQPHPDRKSTRLNSSHPSISYAVFCLKKKKKAYLEY